jgi:DNA-binding PadR family transcriptional regulator
VSKTRILSLNDITILGLLAQTSNQPINGKKLEKTIEVRGMRVWTNIGKSSVYHSLKKLKKLNYLNSHKQKSNRGENKPPLTEVFYQITSLGVKALKNNVMRVITHPEKIIDPFDIAFASAINVSNHEMIELLEMRITEMQKREENLSERLAFFRSPEAKGYSVTGEEETNQDILLHIQALFTRPLAFIECEKEWIKSLLFEYKKRMKE